MAFESPLSLTLATVTFGFTSPRPATAAAYCFWTASGVVPTKATCDRSPDASPWARSVATGCGSGPESPLEQPDSTRVSAAGATKVVTSNGSRRVPMAAILPKGCAPPAQPRAGSRSRAVATAAWRSASSQLWSVTSPRR